MFEKIVTIISLIISVLSIVFSYLNIKTQLNFQLKKDKQKLYFSERDLCAQFLAYCKIASTFNLSNEQLKDFSELYIKLHLIKNEELRKALLSCCDSIITGSKTMSNDFQHCVELFEKYYKSSLEY